MPRPVRHEIFLVQTKYYPFELFADLGKDCGIFGQSIRVGCRPVGATTSITIKQSPAAALDWRQ